MALSSRLKCSMPPTTKATSRHSVLRAGLNPRRRNGGTTAPRLGTNSPETPPTPKQPFISPEIVLVIAALGGLALVLDKSEHAVLHNFVFSITHGGIGSSITDLFNVAVNSVDAALHHNAFNSLLCFSFSDVAAQVLGGGAQVQRATEIVQAISDASEIPLAATLSEASAEVMSDVPEMLISDVSEMGAAEVLETVTRVNPEVASVAGGLGSGLPESVKNFKLNLNLERALKAGLLGVLINGVGYELWMYQLDRAMATPQGDDSLTVLAYKTLTDSLVWGTISNSLNLVGRRVLMGTDPWTAVMAWQQQIMAVTVDEFRFWPVWSAVNFHFVPHSYRVSFAAVGALLWNVYMSTLASSEAKAEAAGATSSHSTTSDSEH